MKKSGLVAIFLLLSFLLAGCGGEQQGETIRDTTASGEEEPDVAYVPTPQPVVERMLELAEVGEDDVVYDLGSGDGRIPITAAREYGARGVGVEIQADLVRQSRQNAREAGVADQVTFLHQDLFDTDISEATAVTLYLLSELNIKLQPKLFRELEPGTPVVSHDFDMGEWKPERTVEVDGSTLYRWTIPADAEGNWEVSVPAEGGEQSYELEIDQRFQEVGGTISVDGEQSRIRNGQLSGRQLSFTLAGEVGRLEAGTRFVGHVADGAIRGSVEIPQDGPAAEGREWTAEQIS